MRLVNCTSISDQSRSSQHPQSKAWVGLALIVSKDHTYHVQLSVQSAVWQASRLWWLSRSEPTRHGSTAWHGSSRCSRSRYWTTSRHASQFANRNPTWRTALKFPTSTEYAQYQLQCPSHSPWHHRAGQAWRHNTRRYEQKAKCQSTPWATGSRS